MSQALNNQQSKTANAYLRTRVLTASPEELRLMLLDGAIKFARQGREGLATRNFEASFNGLCQCRDIVMELITTIRSEVNPELASNVKALYTFIYTQLVEGGHEKNVVKLDKAIELLEYERETWVMLMQKLVEERGSQPQPAGERAAERAPVSLQA
jgi:flagellar protein FliS